MAINLTSLCSLQKKNLNVSFDFDQKTFLIAVFTNDEFPHLNNLLNIPCKEGIAISGYSYDCVSDCYVKECIGYCNLGFVNAVSYIQIHSSWKIRVPLSNDICLKLLSKHQKKLLKDFIKVNCFQNLNVEFLQVVDD